MLKIVILASGQWVSTARLALALRGAGCCVELVCRAAHPALSARKPFHRYEYSPLQPLDTLRAALERSRPDLLIPADEQMVLHLEELWHEASQVSELRKLLERSFGGAAVMQAARSRMCLMRTAMACGIAVPDTLQVETEADLQTAATTLGWPLLLKADATSGGRGVREVRSEGEAARAWRVLRGPLSLARAAKRVLTQKEAGFLRQWWTRSAQGVVAQRLVKGHERTSMAVCHRGRVLACVHLDVLQLYKQRGPSSMVRAIEDDSMQRAVCEVAGALGLSGFCGFDFMQSSVTGERLLIEMNPRPTQLVHLSFGPGRDLLAAYVREFARKPMADRPAAAATGLVSVFPHELQREASGATLAGTHFDVPWEEPALIRRALRGMPAWLAADPRLGPRPAVTPLVRSDPAAGS